MICTHKQVYAPSESETDQRREEQTLGGASEPESLAAVDEDPDDRLTLFFSAPTGLFISLSLPFLPR